MKTSHPSRFLGRLPKHVDEVAHPRLKFEDFLATGYTGKVPAVVDWSTKVTKWTMSANDQLGDCTSADAAHCVAVFTALGEGEEITPSDADVIKFYSGSTGYVPGKPSTDVGGNMQDVCKYFETVGMAGHRIAAYFEVNPSNSDHLRAALWLLGCVSIGMSFPSYAMDAFDAGKPWDAARPGDDTTIEGGHDVLLVGMTQGGNYKVITWGAVQEVTPAFWKTYMAGPDGEAWARASVEWVARNTSPEGLNVPALNTAYTQMTGRPGPFPVAPAPKPAPKKVEAPPRSWLDALKTWLEKL